jgi:hypothetical protein
VTSQVLIQVVQTTGKRRFQQNHRCLIPFPSPMEKEFFGFAHLFKNNIST